mmetsp:Transcript_10481/g.12009  ORF Transcript_10481/g.12009 Transcript_10481/m.12009 type:complete len:109 (+) Transcript_10481:3383-3709(+)
MTTQILRSSSRPWEENAAAAATTTFHCIDRIKELNNSNSKEFSSYQWKEEEDDDDDEDYYYDTLKRTEKLEERLNKILTGEIDCGSNEIKERRLQLINRAIEKAYSKM